MHTLSYSQLSSYLKDPQGWYRRYIAKDDNRTFPALLEGNAYHMMIEKTLSNEQLLAPEEYLKMAMRPGQELELQDKTFDDVYADMKGNVNRGYDRWCMYRSKNLLPMTHAQHTTEMPFTIVLQDKTAITGYIDYVEEDNDVAKIIDWKLVGSWGDDHAYYMQALTYVLALQSMGKTVSSASFVEISKKEFKTDRAQTMNIVDFTSFPESDITALKALYIAAAKEIMTREVQYLPNVFGQYGSGKEAWEYWKQKNT